MLTAIVGGFVVLVVITKNERTEQLKAGSSPTSSERPAAAVMVAAPRAVPASAAPAEWSQFRANPSDAKLVAQIEKMKWWEACVAFGREVRSPQHGRREDAFLAYLKSERMMNSLDRGHASDRTVAVGMTECGVYAAVGLPDGGVNHTTTVSGTSSQLVYRSRNMYVYVEPSRDYSVGVVRAIQH